MISKIHTFFRLIKSVIQVLNKKESVKLVFSFFLSSLNTILELLSITTIIYLLLVISGENLSESRISVIFNTILPEDNIILNSAFLMISVIILKTFFSNFI